jgi:hypothetical protein
MDFYEQKVDFDTTLEELVSAPLSVFSAYKNNIPLLITGIQNNSEFNFDRIITQYSKVDLDAEATKIATRELTLVKAGTVLFLPKGELSVDMLALQGRNLFVKDIKSFTAFYGHYLDLLRSPSYTPIFTVTDKDNTIDIREYSISVWIWSRAHSENGTTLLDVSKYVESCTTTVNGIGNSFSIFLQAIAVDEKGLGIGAGDEVFQRVDIDTNNKRHSLSDFVNPDTLISERLPIPWFKKILQQNDIVFIRFERLTMESPDDREADSMELSASNLPGKVFDMIGLIDHVGSRMIPQNTDMEVSITGRDLNKLLVEDGSYFFPLLFTENADTLFFNTQDDSKWFKRNFLKGDFNYLWLYQMKSVRDSLSFVVNQLSNLGCCNDVLFSSYDDMGKGNNQIGAGLGGRRSQTLKMTGDGHNILEWNAVSGIWQIVDLLVDEQIDDRRIANSQISNPNGNLMSVIDSFCQNPFVEFYGDTYGDKFTFIARTPPFTQAAILSVLDSGDYIDVNLRDVEEMDLDWDPNFFTWFEFDPRNMFLGRTDSIALAYLPIIYFPEIAEAFGNKQMKITDNYISSRAMTGDHLSENRDEFKQKVIEDFMYAIECFCNLPFTETGTITLRRDRRIKAKAWIKIGAQFFYVDAVTNSFITMGERIDGSTTISVSRGMYIDYIRGKLVAELGRKISYWSMVQLDVIRKVLIQKLVIYGSEAEASAAGAAVGTLLKANVPKNTVKVSFGTDKDAFDFFLHRKFIP